MTLTNLIWPFVLFSIFVSTISFQSEPIPFKDDNSDFFTYLGIPQGRLQGKLLKSREGKSFEAYRGIPYAQPPERFEPARYPPPSWKGVYNATDYRSMCLQVNVTNGLVQGDEDCLFINVYTPTWKFNQKLTVLAFIPGGGFLLGRVHEYGPEFFLDHDVILVTFSYRVAALGFLSTMDEVVPGNLGLKDQKLALDWIQDNIIYFGGDKDKVTIFGESAGGASVAFHLLSPLSRGFSKAITQSGCSLDRWAVDRKAKAKAIRLGTLLDCPTNSSLEMVNCLKLKPGKDIVSADIRSSVLESMLAWVPVIEQETSNAENPPFLTDSPRNLYEQGKFSKVPMMILLDDLEGLAPMSLGALGIPEFVDAFNNNWTTAAPVVFFIGNDIYSTASTDSLEWAARKIRDFYFGDKLIGPDTLMNLVDLFGDSEFIHRNREFALLQAQHTPVYMTLLGFKGIWSSAFAYGFYDILGMTHTDNLSYMFTDDFKYPPFPEGSEVEGFSKLIVQLWVDFARTGDPNYEINGKKWLPIQPNEVETKKLNYLYLKNEPEFVVEPMEDRMKLWNEIDMVLSTGIIPPEENKSKTSN